MSDLRALKTKLSAAALLVALALLAGCGSSEDATTSTAGGSTAAGKGKQKEGSHDPCTPRRLSEPVEDPPRRGEQGQAIPVELGRTKLALEVEQTALPGAIPVRFGERPPFKRQDAMLVAVTYRLHNDGPDSVKPSENLNANLLLRASGAQYPYAAELPCGIPITASWALEQGGVNPAKPVAPGAEAKTAAVFIIPKQDPGTRLSLVVPDQVGIALRPTS